MTIDELFDKGMEAFDREDYEAALPYFKQGAEMGSIDAELYVPLCYFSLSTDTSLAASSSEQTEELVRGQQRAVALADAAIRHSLSFINNHGNDKDSCNVCAMMIAHSFNMQYHIVAAGLTTAYRLTTTTTHIERTTLNGATLWEEITGVDRDEYVSLTSFDMHDYHIFGPDEKTKRVETSCNIIRNNAKQATEILDLLGQKHNALMVRCGLACGMADCINGNRTMLLAADWYYCAAQDEAHAVLTDEEFNAWKDTFSPTINEFESLCTKYGAILRSSRKSGQLPHTAYLYQNDTAPALDSSPTYVSKMGVLSETDKVTSKGDFFELFLTLFAQASTVRCIPTIVFASVISIFFGGLFNIFKGVGVVLILIWLAITLIITYIRTLTDSSGIVGKKNIRLYQLIMFGLAILFSINFIVAIIVFVILKFLSKPYK
ncbi:MAG: hypothetical protein IJ017_06310 [Oscillospiraceae bacterium]|nr:hypothetical protein [Oscillospiraceae bacterium]